MAPRHFKFVSFGSSHLVFVITLFLLFPFLLNSKDLWVERAVDSTYEVVHSPMAAISPSSTSVEFSVPGDSDYISPRHTLIEITFKILNADGTDMKKDTDDDPPKTVRVASCQGPAFSLFKSVDIKLCNEKISDSFQTYHIKSYMMVSTSIGFDLVCFLHSSVHLSVNLKETID